MKIKSGIGTGRIPGPGTRNISKWNQEPSPEPGKKIQNPEPGPENF